MSRRSSRKHAFIIIYQIPFHKESFSLSEAAESYLSGHANISEDDRRFIDEEIQGTYEHLAEIDALIAKYATGWNIDRISKTDLAIMRIAVNELCYRGDMPVGVSINEAVELCKTYGDDESSAFVNGILGKIASAVPRQTP